MRQRSVYKAVGSYTACRPRQFKGVCVQGGEEYFFVKAKVQ